jgi:site-specific DNA recombinase
MGPVFLGQKLRHIMFGDLSSALTLFPAPDTIREPYSTGRYCTVWSNFLRGRRAPVASKRRIVAYVRVSTEDQSQNGVSLGAQRARIEAFGLATDRVIDEVIIDAAKSAKSLLRPGMARLLVAVENGGVGTVIVLKLDRLTRSVHDLSDLLDKFSKFNVALVSVGESLDTASAAGRMVTNMLGVVAQWEREAIAERTSIALEQKRNGGLIYSRPPFGYRQQGLNLVPVASQQQGIDIIRSMHEGGASLRQIAAALTNARIAPVRSKNWYASSVKSILESKMYAQKPQ